MTRLGELAEILHTAERRALRAIGVVVAVERYAFGEHAWEIVTVRVPLGRFGALDVYTFSDHIRPAYTLAQEMREHAEQRSDPEEKSTDRILGLSRTDPAINTLPDATAQERLAAATGWTRG